MKKKYKELRLPDLVDILTSRINILTECAAYSKDATWQQKYLIQRDALLSLRRDLLDQRRRWHV
jgi:hypothetical protein